MPSLRERIENNLPVFFFTTFVTGFAAGFGAYRAIQDASNVVSVRQSDLDLLKKEASAATSNDHQPIAAAQTASTSTAAAPAKNSEQLRVIPIRSEERQVQPTPSPQLTSDFSPSKTTLEGDRGSSSPLTAALTDLPLLQGRILNRSDSIVFGEPSPTALFFPNTSIVVRTARKYKRLRMSVGIQDNADAIGSKHFRIYDHSDQLLFEGFARAARPPVRVDIDISDCDSIRLSALDWNNQDAHDYVRWLNVTFVAK